MRERRDEIEIAHPHTFDWVFSNTKSGFYDWIKGDGGLFWIKGKPASGKSTLMKYILEDKRTREALHEKYGRNSLTMPAFFFHDRGINLTQKSLDGLLRSILYQILTDLPALIDCVSEVYGITMENQGHCAWRLSESKKALNAIVQQTKISGCIVLFIDALDEFVGTDIEIARSLTDLLLYQNEQALRIRICASSRPHNVFYDMFGEFPGLAIHDWTQKDIDIYTFDKLGQCKREGLEDLHKEITSRAQGVFLWVRLVIEELSGPLFDGEPIPSLVARLSELPDDLSAFYRLMLEKLPQDKRPVAVRMMELVLCSRNRISLVIFTAAVNLPGHGVSPADRLKQGPLDILRSCEEMVRQIRSFSGGLLEVVQTQKQFRERVPEWLYSPLKRSQYDFTRQYVQLLHQTAKEFVNNPSNSDLMSGKSARESALAGHLRLMEAYTNIAQIGKPT
jgi:NACHT domain